MVQLQRTTFKTNRSLDYFSEKELVAQTGCDSDQWPEMAVKELLDNSLDACETAGVPPKLMVDISDESILVADNGPGIPVATLEGAADFAVRTSDKAKYVSPTRGAQGNALKTIIALPYVLDGSEGRIQVSTDGKAYKIIVRTDAIRQEPAVTLSNGETAFVQNGTSIEIAWPDSAWSQLEDDDREFVQLAHGYAAFNPHAHIRFSTPQGEVEFEPTRPDWEKWLPTQPTSIHWYSDEDLCGLIAAYLAHGRDCTVREFIGEFAGLSRSAKQKKVLDSLGLSGARLTALLASDSELDRDAVSRLLVAMQAEARDIKPSKLGVIGEDHFRELFWQLDGDDDTFTYRSFKGVSDGQPFVVEAAFAFVDDEVPRQLLTGINWSPSINGNPFQQVGPEWNFAGFLQDQRCGSAEPVILAIHVATPKVHWKDRGKSVVDFTGELADKLIAAVEFVTRKWAKQRKREERESRSAARRRDALRKSRTISVKAAAYDLMPKAYLHAAGDVGVAEARQVMYSARQQILEITGKEKLNDAYFTQVLLPNYISEHPDETANWDVVYGARGNFHEPHTGRTIPLGTRAVREYVAKFSMPCGQLTLPQFCLGQGVQTFGPAERIAAVLFFEKEGFFPALETVLLAERYDLALMSSKGVSNTSTRKLIDEIAGYARRLKRRLPLLVVHDLDAQGFTILGTFLRNMRRYEYENDLDVIDFGLRMEDVDAMGLLSEPAITKQTLSKLTENGATRREAEFIKSGLRVELNAMTNNQLIAWLERKLEANGIQKVVPNKAMLVQAARQLRAERMLKQELDAVRDSVLDKCKTMGVPTDLRSKVLRLLESEPALPWDVALAKVL